jgi:hypothetical protein
MQASPNLGSVGSPSGVGIGTSGLGAGNFPGLPNYLGSGRLLNTQIPSSSPGLSGQTYPYGDPRLGGSSGLSYPYPYYPPGYETGQALQGLASLTTAYGQYGQDYQRARLLDQQVERARIGTRMLLRQEAEYLRSLQPKAEDLRRATLDLDLARARRQAPIGEVLSGKAPNDLLAFLKGEQARGKRGPAAPLDESMLGKLNVTTDFGGNIGPIKSGKVNWPSVLMDPAFRAAREKFDVTLREAVERARVNGRVDDTLMRDLEAAHQSLANTLDRVAVDLTMAEYMEAKRHVSWLGEGRRALSDPNVANYFNRRYEARGKTVSDLIDHMSREGLRFAPAVPGGEGAYRTLYAYLAACVEAMQGTKP